MSFVHPLLINAGSYSAPKGQDYPPHRHTCWELVFYRQGHIEAPVGGEVFRTFPGLMLCTPPGIVHSERATTAYSNHHIALHAAPDTPWPRAATDDALGTLSYLCRALVTASRQEAGSNRLAAMAPHLLAQLDCFLRGESEERPAGKGEELVREAERIFEEDFAGTVQVGAVAAKLCVAPSALRAHFARHRGYAPAEGLQRVRLERALALLRSSDLSLQQVARATGFYSPSHLTRHVKSATGESPGRWRRAGQELPRAPRRSALSRL